MRMKFVSRHVGRMVFFQFFHKIYNFSGNYNSIPFENTICRQNWIKLEFWRALSKLFKNCILINSGVQSINDIFHIVDKVENVLVYTYIFNLIDNVEYVVYAWYSRIVINRFIFLAFYIILKVLCRKLKIAVKYFEGIKHCISSVFSETKLHVI